MSTSQPKYPRGLPHFDLGQAYYHLIFRLKTGFLNPEEIELVRNQVINGNTKFYRLIAIQVMGNHVHIVLQPNAGYLINRIIGGIKSETAKQVNAIRGVEGRLWSDKYFDRVVRSKADLDKTLQYLEYNPVKSDIVDDPSKYPG